MKKSQNIILSAVLLTAISSCRDSHKDYWTYGSDANGRTRDTSIYRNGSYHYYRYYGGGWYPLSRNNMINMTRYLPSSSAEIASPAFAAPAAHIRSGGFGGSARGGESGGE
jgi:hypothetical protein